MNKKTKAIILIIVAGLSFTLMNISIRLAGDLPTIQKSFFRNLISAFFAFYIVKKSGTKIEIKKEGLKVLLIRTFLGMFGILANFYAIDHLVLSDAVMLSKMSPFFAIIFSLLFLKEKVSIKQWMAVIIAFIGVLFVIKPSFDLNPVYLVGLAGGMFAGGAYTAVRKLGSLNVTGPFVVFFFSTATTLMNFPLMVASYQAMTGSQIAFLILAGSAACLAQFSLTSAYFNAPAKEISIFDYGQVIYAAIAGFFIFNQLADGFSFLGYLIIISMATLMFFQKQ